MVEGLGGWCLCPSLLCQGTFILCTLFMVFGIFQMKQVAFLPRLLYLQLKLNPHCPWGQTKQLDVTSSRVATSDREAASLLLKIRWTRFAWHSRGAGREGTGNPGRPRRCRVIHRVGLFLYFVPNTHRAAGCSVSSLATVCEGPAVATQIKVSACVPEALSPPPSWQHM